MKSENPSASVESSVAKRTASRFPAASSLKARVCTMLEWRYKLCGITVAPRMPIARYSISRFFKISARRKKSARRFDPQRPREENFIREARADGHDQGDDQRLEHAETAPLQRQNQQHVKARQQHARRAAAARTAASAPPRTPALPPDRMPQSQFRKAPKERPSSGANNARGKPARGRGPWQFPASRKAPGEKWPSGWKSARR